MSNDSIEAILKRLKQSHFRARFHLDDLSRKYINQNGLPVILDQGKEFLNKRLAPAFPPKDGKQTPMRGHPIFIAQHATASCCRSCLYKWHNIEKSRSLTENEKARIIDIIRAWIIEDYGENPPSSPAQEAFFFF
ncbi:DUF4186 domain-containing protein [Swingsia samuiensis]|uniref:DUF4186 domain-containing protein n=1 Tax=Swingsia samuiensis TaxID=1293412 RepID=A0A4Y6UJG3_9PROT|nr:DUF4186 domain-containing protein [Swingsia samuiensis]QDH16531.1 DUF4186 domain-containing protein [Swingsia samuiensis]